jgi:hypothetical protein
MRSIFIRKAIWRFITKIMSRLCSFIDRRPIWDTHERKPSFRGQFHLGSLFDRGLGVPHDEETARELMQMAAAAGDQDALKWLSEHSR